MFKWNMSVQKMLDCVEENLTEPLTLEMLAGKLNYSPFYCTRQFHKYAGISLRNYIRLRKLSAAVIDLRDTGQRILDIAVKYGFSSQEAFTRSFQSAYGMSPYQYRSMPKLLPLMVKRHVFDPYYLGLRENFMSGEKTKEIQISIQVLPAYRFIGIRHIDAPGYWEFWKKEQDIHGYDRCGEVDGVLSSIKSYNGLSGGWFYRDGKRGYMYGIDVPADYSGEVPAGMEVIDFPESPYAVFQHPPYDYDTMEKEVGKAIDTAKKKWKPAEHGYAWNDALPTYQRHNPPKYGQAHLRPLKKLQ